MRVPSVVLAPLVCLAVSVGGACGGDDGGMTNPPPPPPPPPPAQVATVTVSGPTGDRVPGEEIQLLAVAKDASGAELGDRPVTWTSSSSGVATVSEAGLVTTVALGSATIVATSEGKSGSFAVTVREGARVGGEGGTVSAFGGQVRLEVPAGALAEPVSITVIANGSLPRDPSVVLGSGYTLGPAATTFAAPAALTLEYVPAQGPSGVSETALRVHRLESGAFASLEGEVDADADAVTGQVTVLGSFAVRRVVPAEPCTDPEYRQFDFWVGEWNVTTPNQPPGTPPTPSDITREPGGCAVFEDFAQGAGLSINVYNPDDGNWHQTFLFPTGQRQVLIGGLVGDEMVLTGGSPGPAGSFDRWTWTPLTSGRVRQLQEFSGDGGVTVSVGFDGTYTPR